MKEKLQNYSEAFLDYLLDVRGYSETSITTYEIALRQMLEESHVYEEDGSTILDITPFRFKIVKNHKKTIVKKLSAVHSFTKYLEDQCHMRIKLIGDESIKVPKSLPKPIEETYIEEVLSQANLEEKLLISMLYKLCSPDMFVTSMGFVFMLFFPLALNYFVPESVLKQLLLLYHQPIPIICVSYGTDVDQTCPRSSARCPWTT